METDALSTTAQWVIVGLVALAHILAILRSERAHKGEIAAKNAQIDILHELTSTKVREHFHHTKEMLEDAIKTRDDQIVTLQAQLRTVDQAFAKKSLGELHDGLQAMKDQVELMRESLIKELELSREHAERDRRMVNAPQRIESLRLPVDLQEVESILADTGLPEHEIKTILSGVATLPADWQIGKIRTFLRRSILEAMERQDFKPFL